MSQSNVDRVRWAYEGWQRGDIEPYVSLMHPDVYWEGITRGILWWRRTPS